MNLQEQLVDLKRKADEVRAKILKAHCNEAGHNMIFVGCKNAGCCDECNCSVPVHECSRCKISDYGDNEEAKDIIKNCKNLIGQQLPA